VTGPFGDARYDVFLSLGGDDRAAGRQLAGQLRRQRLRVFVDEDDIHYFGGITAQIEHALRSSKTFVVYFSRTYAQRPSCQLEAPCSRPTSVQPGAILWTGGLCVRPARHRHPGALIDAGMLLATDTDLVSYAEILYRAAALATLTLGAVINELSAAQVAVLQLGALRGGSPIPATAVVAAVEDHEIVDQRLGPVLTAATILGELQELALVDRTDTGWLVNPLLLGIMGYRGAG
jgi:hypothetical protein